MPYDSIVYYNMHIKEYKINLFGEQMILNLFKIELMYAHFFIRKPKMVGIIMKTLNYLVD